MLALLLMLASVLNIVTPWHAYAVYCDDSIGTHCHIEDDAS